MHELGPDLHRTPVHCYTVTNGKHTAHLLINGGYCDGPTPTDVEQTYLPSGWTVTGRTWRADWRHLAEPGNAQPTAGNTFPGVSNPPWREPQPLVMEIHETAPRDSSVNVQKGGCLDVDLPNGHRAVAEREKNAVRRTFGGAVRSPAHAREHT